MRREHSLVGGLGARAVHRGRAGRQLDDARANVQAGVQVTTAAGSRYGESMQVTGDVAGSPERHTARLPTPARTPAVGAYAPQPHLGPRLVSVNTA